MSYLSIIPGELGYGMDTIAGRGGAVIKVTNLNASGAGSFRAAVETSGARNIVFEVSGNIDLGLTDLNLDNPFCTIAGQTAPPPGISLINGSFTIRTHDVLIQHIRARGGLVAQRILPMNIDNFLTQAYNIVIDHCSLAWATDDLATSWWGAHDITWSHMLLTGELVNTGVWADCDGKVALSDGIDYNILMLDCALLTGKGRMPLAQANPFVFVNNIVYNWSGQGSVLERQGAGLGGEFVFVGNHYIKGPLWAGAWSQKPILARDNWKDNVHIYLLDNYAPEWSPAAQWDLVDNQIIAPRTYTQVELQVMVPGAWPVDLVARAGNSIFDDVLDQAGAFPRYRDNLDVRLVNDVRAGIGSLVDSVSFPTLAENTHTLAIPANPSADSGDGYTNLEKWLHAYAAQVLIQPVASVTPPYVPPIPVAPNTWGIEITISVNWTKVPPV